MRVLFQPVPGPKEGWRSETSDKAKRTELLYSDSTLQNGRNPYIEGLSQSGGLFSQCGSEGCVFRNPNQPVSPPVPEVQFQAKCYRFQCLPFGLSSAPRVFTKTLKSALALLREMGVQLIAYIDNILILAESRELARSHVEGLVYPCNVCV